MKKITTLALIICSTFLFSACGPQKNTDNITSVTPTTSELKEKTTFSLKELIAKNIAQKCTWETNGEDGNSVQGEILISGKKFKQIIKMKNPTGETQFNGISDGEWMYTWSDDSTTDNMAFKMKIDQTETVNDNQPATASKVDWNQELNYNCQPTTINEADLTIPKDIKFTDINDLTKQLQQ